MNTKTREPVLKDCPVCHEAFLAHNQARIYCGKSCRAQARRMGDGQDAGLWTRECRWCRNTFETPTRNRTLCSPECAKAQKDWLRRKSGLEVRVRRREFASALDYHPVEKRISDYGSIDAFLARDKPTWSPRRTTPRGAFQGNPREEQFRARYHGTARGGARCELCGALALGVDVPLELPFDILCRRCLGDMED